MRANKQLVELLTVFCEAGYDVLVRTTCKPGDAVEIAQRLAGEVDLVVSCGGDGTFNEAVTGLLRSGVAVPIGHLPAGTTNDFAISLGIPTNLKEAAKLIACGTPEEYDIGRFGDRYFTYVASFGAFTRASYATPQNVKNALGQAAYLLEGIQELSQLRMEHIRLLLDDETEIEDDFIFGAICNSTSVGGILTLDPKQVDLRDGKFEVLLIRMPKSLQEISECLLALQKQQYNNAMMTFRSASHIEVEAEPDMLWTLDGEKAVGSEEISIVNLHHAIQLIK
jgi:YegS/Rv2252/BmrU family lipid kinase